MSFQFATCERHRALEFLKVLYPSRKIEDVPDSKVSKVLDFVEQDIIRIPDPMMHGMRVGIHPSVNWKPEHQNPVYTALKEFHEDE